MKITLVNFYFLMFSELVRSVCQEHVTQVLTLEQNQSKTKIAHVLTHLDHQTETFEEFYLCFYPRIPQI